MFSWTGTCLVLVSLCSLLVGVRAHGRLINPPGRSTMWRYGFKTPRNSNDHQLSCGGFGVQFYRNAGRCGICGDPYDGPRENEAGGKFATGTIAGRYTQGGTLMVQVEITVNHGGWFEFRLCPNNDPKKAATQACLDRNLLKQLNGETRFHLPQGLGVATVQLRLPTGLTCSQCVLQWRWNTASNLGCDGSHCCHGCGPQEQFYGCADIAVSSSAGGSSGQGFVLPSYYSAVTTLGPKPGVYVPPVPGNNGNGGSNAGVGAGFGNGGNGAVPSGFLPVSSGQLPVSHPGPAASQDKCVATEAFRSPTWNDWCQKVCANAGACPPDICAEPCRSLDSNNKPEITEQNKECKANEFFRNKQPSPTDADKWCQDRCSSGYCPLEYCEKDCWNTY